MITFSNRKIGGIRFIRIGKWQFSFCVVNRPSQAVYKRRIARRAITLI